MNSLSNQLHVFELREARFYATRLAHMVSRDVWQMGILFPPAELSVRESKRRDTPSDETAATVFTFRFEGGTVVRIIMRGRFDPHFSMWFWNIEQAEVRCYPDGKTSSSYADKPNKSTFLVLRSFFSEDKWWENKLPRTDN